MIVFADASAIVAILAEEAEEEDYLRQLDAAGSLLWSSITRWEVIAAVARDPRLGAEGARAMVLRFGNHWNLTLVPIGEREDALAYEAYRTYGKRSGHPARLNMGDCFAYACARANGARLLYKGDDFAMTDLA